MLMPKLAEANGVHLTGHAEGEFAGILTPQALDFVVSLERRFRDRRQAVLRLRQWRQDQLDQGELPDFLPETAHVRAGDWRIAGTPNDLQDRRVEITGPVDRKMVINALNSGARVFMADFEDAHAPTWEASVRGQINLRDAVTRTLEYTDPSGKEYRLNRELATLMVRPRGWHLSEKHLIVDGEAVSASLFDFGLYFFHNAHRTLQQGSGPYFYLPKLESHLEARLWNDVFRFAEQELDIPQGSIKCTVLIETILAAFEMDEILFELRDYIVGLNCGRWDYIFSFIKRFSANPDWVLPDRSQVTMTSPFLRAYSQLLIQTCHRRGAHAMGGMAAQIPINGDPVADAQAKDKVRQDKEREAGDGHDGTWVAHPGLVPVAMAVFDRHMPGPNQLERLRDDVQVSAADLLRLPEGSITEQGVRSNVSAALRYLAAWLSGRGAVPIHHLMEDAATAEIARAQLWQWVRYPKGVLDDGREVTLELFRQVLDEELAEVRRELGELTLERYHFAEAAGLLRAIVEQDRFGEFLTLPAYELID